MRIGWRRLLATMGSILIGGILIAWLGVIDIRASSGHWHTTAWFLHWVMRSSVRTSAIGLDVPDLGNPAYLPLAAGHYESACADCHGSPERDRPPVALAMLPPPPDLKEVVGQWSDAELFQIVKHGVRYTGMPAWPAVGRDDEVWAMVAFLRRYRELDIATYRRLRGDPETGGGERSGATSTFCESCHAPARLDSRSLIPKLDGQSRPYLIESLRAFRGGLRPSGVMQTAAHRLDEAEIESIAGFYSERQEDEPSRLRPRALVVGGDALRRIPACSACHDKAGLNPVYPKLSGLARGYIRNQLQLFVAGKRGGTAYSDLMTRAVRNLTSKDIEALADYYGR